MRQFCESLLETPWDSRLKGPRHSIPRWQMGKQLGVVFRSSDLWRPTGRATVAEGRSTGTSAWRLNEEREDKKEKDNLVQKKASLLIWPRLKRSGLSASELGELCARMGIAMTMGRGCIIDFSLACVNSRVCRWSVFFFLVISLFQYDRCFTLDPL